MKKMLWKVLVLGVFILIFGNQIFASDWELGIKAGLVRSKAEFSLDLPYLAVESLNTFSVGSYISYFFLWDQLGIQPEIHYSVKGFDIVEQDLGQEISSQYRISYIEVPVLISYKFPLKGHIKPGLVFGPYFGFAHKVEEVQTVFGSTERRELDDNLENTDVGLVFGGNVRYRLGPVHVLLSVRYNLGLVNISKNIMDVAYEFGDDDWIKNRALTVSLGVAFIPTAYR
jgi:hypothetical protein